jgi:glycosyltransferase involved in cell wall biosynthesis
LKQNHLGISDAAPILSVLMPAYNSRKTITLAVQSCLLAMPKRSELLVYLDGCSDDTADKLSLIRDPRLRVIESGINQGPHIGRQILLNAAKADIVATMDSDDVCFPWRFRAQLKTIIKTNADMVFGGAILFGPGLKYLPFLPEVPYALTSEQSGPALVLANPFVNSTMIGNRSAILKVGGYSNRVEDLFLWLQASRAGLRIVKTRGYMVCYRVHPDSLSHSDSSREVLQNDPSLAALRSAHRIKILAGIDGSSEEEKLETLRSNLGKKAPLFIFHYLGLRGVSKLLIQKLFAG